MKAKKEYWDRLFKGYEKSGLTQKDFCKQQGVPFTKFKYRWRKKIASTASRTGPKKRVNNHFEPVLISKSAVIAQEALTDSSIIIRFPNQICCEVKTDIKSKDFCLLLNQLRSLC